MQPGQYPGHVAKAVYGDANLWEFIAKANGLTNASGQADANKMRPGMKLKIPPKP
jgi:nucleoid-associated protein YgaU